MEEFKKLWKEFILGTRSLNYRLKKEGKSPYFIQEWERFKKRIVEPMDATWRALPEFEKLEFREKPKW